MQAGIQCFFAGFEYERKRKYQPRGFKQVFGKTLESLERSIGEAGGSAIHKPLSLCQSKGLKGAYTQRRLHGLGSYHLV